MSTLRERPFKRFVKDNLRKGEKVNIGGFGSFSIKQKDDEKKLNLITEEVVVVPARKVVKFKAGADLSGTVN